MFLLGAFIIFRCDYFQRFVLIVFYVMTILDLVAEATIDFFAVTKCVIN